jgi:hypothetical protein
MQQYSFFTLAAKPKVGAAIHPIATGVPGLRGQNATPAGTPAWRSQTKENPGRGWRPGVGVL